MSQATIQSIQVGNIVIAAGSSSGTYTLPTSVVTANAFVIFQGITSPNASAMDAAYSYGGVVLTNSNTVTASTGVADPSNARTVYFTVIEFISGIIKTNQSGSTVCNSSNNTQTSALGTA